MVTAGATFVTEKIPRRGSFELPIELPEGRSRVTWEFSTKDYDIGFSVNFFAASALKDEEVEEARRIDCHDIPHHGRFESPEGGKLTLVWDNSFSRLRSKTLSYSVTVEAISGGGSEGSGTIVRTTYGPGTLIDERADGVSVVDLPFGRAYLRPSCVLKKFGGSQSPTTVVQLQRMELLRSEIRAEGLAITAEEQSWLDDGCLYRMLWGRGWDVAKAMKLARESLEWRFHTYRPQDLDFVDMMPLLHEFQVFIAGNDNSGRPVVVVKMDKPGCSLTPEDKLRVLVFVIEHTVTNLLRGTLNDFVLFVDLGGFGRHHCGPRAIKLASITPGPLQKHYIGRIHKLVIYNTPIMFKALWAVASRLISREIEGRILMLKGDSDEKALTTIKSMFPPTTLMKMTAVHADFSLLKLKPVKPPAAPTAPAALAATGGGGGGGGGSGSGAAETSEAGGATSPPGGESGEADATGASESKADSEDAGEASVASESAVPAGDADVNGGTDAGADAGTGAGVEAGADADADAEAPGTFVGDDVGSEGGDKVGEGAAPSAEGAEEGADDADGSAESGSGDLVDVSL